ncbi:bifunctional diaminohydroxyphosphoribosylaminopyrimidine deaminase/5-amino-6-(5-phosphoribosylamino)uracil reductase RibD [Idiomarina sp. HP20-50]|uniref:bifunctional diaminohydroxyphosphoribosylaminopyrimidine deaminase/5-amino-6-(5-phosphoribosylamino)uracil reductase RibD n=1 Tax=Idiomarina sp. HP20-50 TaxID=3070813 RepID=UPI00294AECCE|nr:bifunctional diaminohydroxyphosphoribosylaminopyrimidine deaminase/5-amino-6-(5-phosphoribosylamino)uracil reductase RibD [Idiomarina sp. HP20-50]MDV6317270.1 bifunctional diaminohydroxyphosphoribosylaminopyrimidine deaminase/5-amino-6-(5-phosphoribosylamino)uracil reductase RibD [Idiomarina sp. HP20-50]
MSEKFMLEALAVSKQALPYCKPNPPVGCVLVKNNQVVSKGFTQAIGRNHAEVEALNAYSGDLSGVIAYVTLEPCSFVGRTGACASALVAAGIKYVVIAMLDPDLRNNGKGVELLKSAGVKVELGLGAEMVTPFLSPYLSKL